MTYPLVISTPEGERLRAEVLSLFLTGAGGELAILAGHIPLVTTVRAGECRVILADGTERRGTARSGILSVSRSETVLLTGDFSWNE